MDRVAHLRTAAQELSRRIYASLPWGYRIAEVFIHLAADDAALFGKVVYAEFLRRGIEGMPDVNGVPAASVDTTRPRLADRLPNGYGKELGVRAMRLLYRMGLSPDRVSETMAQFLADFLERYADKLRSGMPVFSAEKFVLNKLQWVVRSGPERRKTLRDKNEILVREKPGDEGETEDFFSNAPDLDDPRGYHRLEQNFSKDQLKDLFEFLAKNIHPDIPEYIMLKADGYKDTEIIGDTASGAPGMLPTLKTTPRNFNENYKRHIQPAIKAFFEGKPFRKTHR